MDQNTEIDTKTKLSSLLEEATGFVTYAPLRGEASFREFFTLPNEVAEYPILPRASLVPFKEAEKAMVHLKDRKVAVLLPGRQFDVRGTRKGQGGGWYDRFLAVVPREWIRVGFCRAGALSDTPLTRNVWDQAVDYVCVQTEHKKTYRVFHGERN